MNSAIFIPEVIKVGYNNRNDTYTGKLAYVIYYDQKGKLRKEASWQTWRDKKIEPSEFKNEPTEGFVLNKKVGGDRYSWNPRQTYTRVYDPRGFEFEISIPNLLYILENTNSIKGKGLEGEFVYGWDGTELLLIPTGAPEYVALTEYASILTKPERIHTKDLIFGATYRTNKNNEWVYLGKFEYHPVYQSEKSGPRFFFWNGKDFETIKSISGKLVQCVSSTPVSNYAEMMDKLEHNRIYSPIDANQARYEEIIFEEFEETRLNDGLRYYFDTYIKYMNEYHGVRIDFHDNKIRYGRYHYVIRPNGRYDYGNELDTDAINFIENINKQASSLQDLFKLCTFYKMQLVLKNGKDLQE